jgi:phage-related protein
MAHFTDGTNDFTADKGLSRTTTPRVLTATFGDGFEQRLIDGINPLKETYAVSFTNRTRTEAINLINFFEDKNAVTKFIFAPPELGSKTATTSFSSNTITSSGLDTTVLSPSTPSHILVTASASNDGGYTLNQASTATNNATTLTVTSSLTTEVSTASVLIQAGIAVVCSDWSLNYDYGDYYSVSGSFERVYEA